MLPDVIHRITRNQPRGKRLKQLDERTFHHRFLADTFLANQHSFYYYGSQFVRIGTFTNQFLISSQMLHIRHINRQADLILCHFLYFLHSHRIF